MKEAILGIDAGTRSVKAALFDEQGEVLAEASAGYALHVPRHGWAEQAPSHWWRGLCGATRALGEARGAHGVRIAAIGVCAQMCGTVVVDENGTALTNCLTWLDTRSAGIAREITAGWPRVSGYGLVPLIGWLRVTNGAPNLGGKDPTSKMLWLKRHAPEVWARVHKVLDVKDYLVRQLCGRFTTTSDCAHLTWLFDSREGRRGWHAPLMRRLGLDESLFPEVCPSSAIVGALTPAAARSLGLAEGIPVCAGMGDLSASGLGAGSAGIGIPFLSLGTSAFMGVHRRGRWVDPFTGIATLCTDLPQRYLLVAAQECAGACAEWGTRTLGGRAASLHDFDEAAAQAPPGARRLLFFPWMFGERVPLHDDAIRGGFANLSLEHEPRDMARAILEGVALNSRWALTSLRRSAQHIGDEVHLVGGGARSAQWCQILADVLQAPIRRAQLPALAGARGAAMAAAVAVDWHASLDEACNAWVRLDRALEPVPANAAVYDMLYQRFTEYGKRNRRWFRRLNRTFSRGQIP